MSTPGASWSKLCTPGSCHTLSLDALPCRFVGDQFSAADINLEFPIEFLAVIPGVTSLDKFPKLQAWRANFKKRSAYKKALEANGPYDLNALFK